MHHKYDHAPERTWRHLDSCQFKTFLHARPVAMDIWDPHIALTRSYVPQAEEKIVFDRYHLMTHMGKAVDMVRIAVSGRRDIGQVEVSLVLQ